MTNPRGDRSRYDRELKGVDDASGDTSPSVIPEAGPAFRAGTKRVVFARINRRLKRRTEPLNPTSFGEEMRVLIERGETTAVQHQTGEPDKTWHAGDFTIHPDGTFVTGTLGYSESRTDRVFDEASRSWLKGQAEDRDSGSDQTISVFAVDLRDEYRWVAFTTAPRLQYNQFRKGLELVLQAAVMEAGLIGHTWEVDLVTSKAEVHAWLEDNPHVRKLVRTVKFTNPGRDIDDDREEMDALGAARLREEYTPPRLGELNTASPEFDAKLDGLSSGFVDVQLEAQEPGGKTRTRFNSKERAESTEIEAASLEDAADGVLRALAAKAGELFRRAKEDG